MIYDVAEERHVEVFAKLADGVIHETTPEVVKPFLSPDFPIEKLNEYLEGYSKPSDMPDFRRYVLSVVNRASASSVRMFALSMDMLDNRLMAPALTNSTTMVRDMTPQEAEKMLQNWRDSYISLKRKLFRTVVALTMATFGKCATELHLKALGYPGKELREKLWDEQVIDPYVYPMLPKPETEGEELYLPDIDAIIIGSGSGAGVVAHTLSQQGLKSLVLEKGKYYANNEFVFNDCEGFEKLYELQGEISTDSQVVVLAGSTFGGGSAINWGASLKTPFKVRKEWYDDFGLEWAANESYDNCVEYVLRQMGCTDQNIPHSHSNKVLLEGSEKLDYKSKVIPQNSGGHQDHSCGFCYLGCKYGIKQGSANCWFRDAAENGTKFMDQVRVDGIIHKNGAAEGVLCTNVVTNKSFTIRGPKKIVVSAGALNTPVILKRSGFKNKNIGKHLKLHPVVVIFGDWGRDVITEPFKKPIMTAVVTETDDVDGKAHGAKIEAVLHTPLLENTWMPWFDSDSARQFSLKYNNLSAMLIITRDTGEGSVNFNPSKPNALDISYSVNQFDRDALQISCLTAADILYVEGAKEIIHPQHDIPSFKSEKPKDERLIDDEDYQKWRSKVAKIRLDSYATPYGSAHQMSTCRISGKGPQYGAADLRGRLFECDNVYVADSSVMPTASGANPMVTAMAMARHIALGIAKDLKPKEKL
ncbi:uncharacterized protein KQ657_004906 [Scheffersomyces spartinae]|uniref:Long-chain-alcohol oxidase n=1 Tax=Scheffersomyces spartinae TaxID=45513 RepID=A0A9P7VAV1_9ASCO|nr:uncharacterized protein KQ657_004906 [Scheffersomyces spartinae]KAG7194196.1 hypothetical protein KQ657_004906 [Scheffersomyces spartinae]